jgi:hypothetical protein
MLLVHFARARIIAVTERAWIEECLSDLTVFRFHGERFEAQGAVHAAVRQELLFPLFRC